MEARSDKIRIDRISKNRSRLIHLLALMSFFCIALVLFRFVLTGNLRFFYFIWNLFLAWIPFWISMGLFRAYRNRPGPSFPFWIWLLPWLFFYPNAPYLLTDMIHITENGLQYREISIWFDIFLVLFFSFAGLLLGFMSMLDIFKLIQKWYGLSGARWFYLSSTFLCAIGLFVGRFLRWNSWDLFIRPMDVISNTLRINGYAFFEMSVFVLFFFVFLIFVYEMLFRLMELGTD